MREEESATERTSKFWRTPSQRNEETRNRTSKPAISDFLAPRVINLGVQSMLVGMIDRRLLECERRFESEFDSTPCFHFSFRRGKCRDHWSSDGSRIAAERRGPATVFSFFRDGRGFGGSSALFLGSHVAVDFEPLAVHDQADEFQRDFRFSMNVPALFSLHHADVRFRAAGNYHDIVDEYRRIDRSAKQFAGTVVLGTDIVRDAHRNYRSFP